MNRFRFIFLIGTVLGCLVSHSGCGIETNQQRALHAKRNSELNIMLLALEAFREKHGRLPTSLQELQQNDSTIKGIAIEAYTYRVNGFLLPDGSRWLLAVPDPKANDQLMVGRLPSEIALKKKKTTKTE